MFEQLIIYLIAAFDNSPKVDETEINVSWLYIIALSSNYGHKNVFKIGFSKDVESHLTRQLSADHVIDKQRSFKIQLDSVDSVKDLKKEVKLKCKGHHMKTRSNFCGKSDWYDYDALDTVVDTLSLFEIQEN